MTIFLGNEATGDYKYDSKNKLGRSLILDTTKSFEIFDSAHLLLSFLEATKCFESKFFEKVVK